MRRRMDRVKFWLMEHNPAEYYDTPVYKIYMSIIGIFFKCHECYDGYYYPSYGVAPHWHDITKTGSLIGSTELYDKKEWPENYDDVDDGCGVYYCPNKNCENSKEAHDDSV